ncbi:MFS transporter [Rhodococcus jostii]|uniref:MFS transporter n=1 Tax=Rhodococcus jostii TaxID=132919 RepID=A0ABU4CRT8_RHOJO|nr:MFS transporter [Rhodococcus jostii]MDV6286310.1 MFS transporter [Rhodococcus jostii]
MSTGTFKKAAVRVIEPGAESRRTAWGLTSLLVLLYIVNYGDKVVLGIIAQPLAEELGLRSSQIGLVGSLFFLTFTIGGFFAGALNRWLTLRWALVLLALGWSVVMLPMVITATFAVLLVSRLVLGLAEGPTSALLHTAAYSWHPPTRRALPGALLAGSASVAKIAVAPLLAYVTVTMGWRSALVALSIAGVAWCVVWVALWRQGPYVGSNKKDEAVQDAASAESAEPTIPWVRIFTTRTFVSGVFLVMSCYAMSSVILTWLPSYFEVGLGYSRLQAGSMFAFPSITGLILMLLTSTIGDRLITRGVSSRLIRIVLPATGVLFCGAFLLVLPAIDSPALAVLVVSLGYGFASPVFPMLNAAISEICPPRQTAGTMGVFLAIMAIGGLIAPYGTGLIVDAASTPAAGYATSFQVLGVVAALCALLAVLLANPERDKAKVRSTQ